MAMHPLQVADFFKEPATSERRRWRAEWERSDAACRNNGLLEHLAGCMVQDANGRKVCNLTFLGRRLCQKAFCRITGVNPCKFVRLARDGVLSWERKRQHRPRTLYDTMFAAVMMKVDLLRNSSPFARPGDHGDLGDDEIIQLPFHEKIYLYRMIAQDYEDDVRCPLRVPLFTSRPTYSTFRHARGAARLCAPLVNSMIHSSFNPLTVGVAGEHLLRKACLGEPRLRQVAVPQGRGHRQMHEVLLLAIQMHVGGLGDHGASGVATLGGRPPELAVGPESVCTTTFDSAGPVGCGANDLLDTVRRNTPSTGRERRRTPRQPRSTWPSTEVRASTFGSRM